MSKERAGSSRKPSIVRRILFTSLTVFLILVFLDLSAFILWTFLLPKSEKAGVQVLCRQRDAPEKIPNSFWHHEFNPAHPKYEKILNSWGIKGNEFLLPKPTSELRIVCIGDSTVEGTGVAPNETFPQYLEDFLREKVEQWPRYETVNVINAGIGSHNSAFNLTYLAFRLIHFAPDIVVIKSSYNDYLPYIIPGMKCDYTHAFPKPYHRVSSSVYWSAARHSYFLKLVGSLVFRDEVAVPFPGFSGALTREQFNNMDYFSNEDKFYVYGENIRSMILLCRGRNINVICADLPTSPTLERSSKRKGASSRFRDLIVRLEAELERVASEENVAFVRTVPFTRDDFWDHVHCTAKGNRKVAQVVASAIEGSPFMNEPLPTP